MSSLTEISPLASFLANLRREVAVEADRESQERGVSTTNAAADDDDESTSTDSTQFEIVQDHARTHQRQLSNRRNTPRHTRGDVSPRYPRHYYNQSHHHHHGCMIQRQLSPVSVSSVESSPGIFSTSSSSLSPRNSSKRLLSQHPEVQKFVPPPLLDSNFSRWEMPTSAIVDRSPGELCKPRRGLDFLSESEASSTASNKKGQPSFQTSITGSSSLSSSSSSSYGLFVPFTDSQDEQDDDLDAAVVDNVRTSRWDAIISVTKALAIVDGQQHHNSHSHSHSHRCSTTAPKMIPRKSSLVDLNDLLVDESST